MAAQEEDGTSTVIQAPERWLQTRYVVVFAACMVNTVFYLMRVNLSVAIVAIALDDEGADSEAKTPPHYDWDSTERGNILSSFYWGYTATQLPALILVKRLGPKRLVFLMALLSSVASFLFVPLAALGCEWACASRTLLGISQSGLMASVQQLIAHWSPVNERSRMVVYAFCGQELGTVAALASSGVLSDWAGWPWVFYVSGAAGLLLAVTWLWLVADSPAEHRHITPQERALIENSIAGAVKTENHKDLQTPWRSIFTSLPFWSLLLALCAQAWGSWTLLTGTPAYMSGVLGFNLSQNGFLSSLPFVAMWVANLVLGWLSDELLRRGLWSVGTSRKIGNTIGLYGSAIALVILSYLGNDPEAAVAILVVAVCLSAGCSVGNIPNFIDLSPNFVAVLVGLSNAVACGVCIAGPILTGYIVVDNESAAQWRIVFFITAGIFVLGNTLFIIFGSGEEQPWNTPEWVKASQESDTETARYETTKIS